jgi:HrpA-like RNA helicase
VVAEFDTTLLNTELQPKASEAQGRLPAVPPSEYAWVDGRMRPALPIDQHLAQIAQLLEAHRVVIVEGEPGCGKTLRLGQMLALSAIEKAVESGCAVPTTHLTQTRRNALRWNYKTISNEMGSTNGDPVGFEIRGQQSVISDNSVLVLRIDQSMVNLITQQGGLLPEGVIVIDEAHENSISMTLLLGVVRAGLANSPNTKVVLTSATLNAARLSQLFDGAPIVRVAGQDFAVASRVERLRTAENEHHTQAAARVAREIMDSFVARTLSDTGPSGASPGEGVTRGAVLVLLPGKEDLLNVQAELAEYAAQLSMDSSFEFLLCHGSSEPSVQDEAQSPLKDGTLRLILGTEILRTSVTVSGLIGVVDSLQIKREVVSDTGARELRKISISKIDAKQGCGRVGREARGFYIAVSHDDEFENLLPAPIPVTHTGALSGLILQAALVGLDIDKFPFVTPPDWARLERDRLSLQRLGALDQSFQITELGRKLATLPLEPRSAAALLKGQELGIAPAVAVAVSALEAGEFFFLPHHTATMWIVSESIAAILKDTWGAENLSHPPLKESTTLELEVPWLTEIEESKFGRSFEVDVAHPDFPHKRDPWRWVASAVRAHWARGSGSDFIAAVHAYQMYMHAASQLGNGEGRKSWRKMIQHNKHLAQWSSENLLHYKALQRVAETLRDLHHRWPGGLEGVFYSSEELLPKKGDINRLSKALLAGYFDQFGALSGQRPNSFHGLGAPFMISDTSACSQRAPLVLTGRVRAINTGQFGSTHMHHFTEMCAPIEVSWLQEIAPQHVTYEYAGAITYHRDKDSVRCGRITSFRGVPIKREEVVVAEPELATPVFVRWMLLNRELLPESLQQILNRNDAILTYVAGINRHLGLGIEIFESGQSYQDWLARQVAGCASCNALRSSASKLLLPAQSLVDQALRGIAARKS